MAYLIEKEKRVFGESEFVEIKIYEVENSRLFPEGIKYSMVFVKNGICLLRYDNERNKGHHKHISGKESGIEFKGVEQLKKSFYEEVNALRRDLYESSQRHNQNRQL